MEGQQFCLRWHNFQNTLLSSLPKLLDGGYLTDVTLSAGGRHIRAHRIILSACSYYFKELFKDLSALQHPVIVLPGMEYANLCALVTFMYNGEVNIYQEQLPALLAMADTLHIRGLADIAGKSARNDSNGQYVDPPSEETKLTDVTPVKKEFIESSLPETPENVPLAHHAEHTDLDGSYQDTEETSCSVETKPYYSINAKLTQKERKQCSNLPPKQIEKTLNDDKTDEMLIADDQSCTIDDSKTSIDTTFRYLTTPTARTNQTCNKTSVMCLICGKQLSNQYNLRVHMETHSNSSYSCTACSHVSRSRDALRKHVSYRHPVATPQKRPRYSITKPEDLNMAGK